jgi:hypothetical protein
LGFQPAILSPEPDPFYVRELRRIDPDLRLVWGYQRYLKQEWAVERRLPPERYFTNYASLLSSGEPRFIEQPIFDTAQPLFDEVGNSAGYAQVGTRQFDLAPEYEWLQFAPVLDQRLLTDLRRMYAWNRNHSITRLRLEAEAEQAALEKAAKQKRMDAAMDELPRVFRETGRHLFGGQPEKVLEGTQI